MAKLINISRQSGRLDSIATTISLKTHKKMTKEEIKQEEKDNEGEVYLSAVLSHRQFDMIKNGDATLEVPYGVVMENKAGSRILEFRCDDLLVAKELVGGLDDSGIPWQEEFDSEETSI